MVVSYVPVVGGRGCEGERSQGQGEDIGITRHDYGLLVFAGWYSWDALSGVSSSLAFVSNFFWLCQVILAFAHYLLACPSWADRLILWRRIVPRLQLDILIRSGYRSIRFSRGLFTRSTHSGGSHPQFSTSRSSYCAFGLCKKDTKPLIGLPVFLY